MSHNTKSNELRTQILEEMEARRIDHKTYVDAEWLLDQYDTLKDTEKEEAVREAIHRAVCWIPIADSLPPIDIPVLVVMRWFTKVEFIYAVLKYKDDEDDHNWVTADDETEISSSLFVIAWQHIVPLPKALTTPLPESDKTDI